MNGEVRTIRVFPRPKWIEPVSCDGKPCRGEKACGNGPSSGGNCQSPACGDSQSCAPSDVIDRVSRASGEKFAVKIAGYTSLASIETSLGELNAILEANHEDLRVELDNFELVFSQIAPIVAVDGVLAAVGKIPSEAELIAALRLASLTGQSSSA